MNKLPQGTGYESYQQLVLAREITGGERIEITSEDNRTLTYTVLSDGRVKMNIPVICYDESDETASILNNKSRWRILPAEMLRDYVDEKGLLIPDAENITFMTAWYEVYQPINIINLNSKIPWLYVKKPSRETAPIPLRQHLEDMALPERIPKF
jgi:hypothetical protein